MPNAIQQNNSSFNPYETKTTELIGIELCKLKKSIESKEKCLIELQDKIESFDITTCFGIVILFAMMLGTVTYFIKKLDI